MCWAGCAVVRSWRAMSRTRVRGLNIASRRRRAAAVVVDLFALVVPLVAVGAVVGLLYTRRRGPDGEPREIPTFRVTARRRIAFAIAMAPLEVRGRNSRSPGWRVLGLRYADVSTGGPVSVRSALIRLAFRTVWSEVSSQLLAPWQRRAQPRFDAAAAEFDKARRSHPEGSEAQTQAVSDVLAHTRLPLGRGCLGRLLVIAAPDLPALWSERKQTFPERLAGIAVVRD